MTISSGNGVDEVCRAVFLFVKWLEGKYDFEVLKIEYAKCENCYKSVLIKSKDRRLLGLKGTHLWRCQSPFRPKHKRKNWYFSLTIQSEFETAQFNENQVVYQTLKSPKKGGQHVNKTSSGVRALYPPLGLEAISFDERSQHLNKKIALKRLLAKAEELNRKQKAKQKTQRWQESRALKRGGAVLVFEEFNFKMKYKSSISP